MDIRYALRTLRRNPAFTAVAVLSLSLGLGANTAIFSVMDKVMLRNLPVAHPEQLVELLHRLPREGHRGNSFSREACQDLRDHNHTLSALIAASPASLNVRGAGLDLEKVDGAYVDGRLPSASFRFCSAARSIHNHPRRATRARNTTPAPGPGAQSAPARRACYNPQ